MRMNAERNLKPDEIFAGFGQSTEPDKVVLIFVASGWTVKVELGLDDVERIAVNGIGAVALVRATRGTPVESSLTGPDGLPLRKPS